MLPKAGDDTPCNIAPTSKRKCFAAGDQRTNLSVQLAAIQTLFLREHNRIVRALHGINSNWDDERLYQEGRRILGAIIQHISYNKALPMFLGSKTASKYSLYSKATGYETRYNAKLNGATSIASNIAFRFHALVPSRPYLVRPDNQRLYFNMSDAISQPSLLYEKGYFDGMIKGMLCDGVQTNTRHVSSELTTKENKKFGASYGKDLASTDIQRCRDFGLPGYNEYRQFCGLEKFASFQDITGHVFGGVVPVLERLYSSVDDIDLIVGGRSERHLKGALVGPTFACILGRNFKRLKYADRYWHENELDYLKFSPGQLDTIRKASISRIVCDNSDDIHRMPVNGFKVPSKSNPLTSCSDIDAIDLNLWREE